MKTAPEAAIDGRGLIVRLYEGHGSRGPATLTFAHPVAWAEECNLLEDRLDTPVQFVRGIGPERARALQLLKDVEIPDAERRLDGHADLQRR